MNINKINEELNKPTPTNEINEEKENLISNITNEAASYLLDWLCDKALDTIIDLVDDALRHNLHNIDINQEQDSEINKWVRNMNGLPHPPIAGNMQTRAQIEKRINNLIEELNTMSECEYKRLKRAELTTLQSILY